MELSLTYVYDCPECGKHFEVTKSMKDYDRNENCPRCGEFAIREPFPQNVYVNKAKVTHAEYNPGLGMVVKNEAHKKEILKQKNLIEIGNDYGSGEKMQKLSEQARQEKFKKRYDDV